jgi:hypothetical protein
MGWSCWDSWWVFIGAWTLRYSAQLGASTGAVTLRRRVASEPNVQAGALACPDRLATSRQPLHQAAIAIAYEHDPRAAPACQRSARGGGGGGGGGPGMQLPKRGQGARPDLQGAEIG